MFIVIYFFHIFIYGSIPKTMISKKGNTSYSAESEGKD